MKAEKAEKADPLALKQWLEDRHLTAIEIISVRIGRQNYLAGRYEAFGRTNIYCVGALPASYRRSTRVAYQLPSDQHDWYIAGYIGEERAKESSYHNPFGAAFILAAWIVDTNFPIDYYSPRPYKRMVAKILPKTGSRHL